MPTATMTRDRPPLNRELVIETAIALADRIGADALTIRRLADALGVKPMSIYHHLPNKEAILDGMVDAVFDEMKIPAGDGGWREAIEGRCRSARAVLARHPWAVPLLESRTSPGPGTLGHHDAVLGIFRTAGFSPAMTSHAYALLDAFVYGFAIQEASLPDRDDLADLAAAIIEPLPAAQYPHLTAFTAEYVLQPGYDFGDEFDFGLGLILDGLEAAVRAETG